MAEWRHLHPEDMAGEESFWVAKKAERKERRAARRAKMARKRYIEAQLDGPSIIDKNSEEWADLFRTSERAPGRGAAAKSSFNLNLNVV
jgi:hypothetical protein